MADEANSEGAGSDAGEENTGADPRHDQHLVRTRKDRDAWKQKATAAEQRLAEIQAKERDAQAAKEREAGEWTKIEQRYQTKVRDLEEKLAEATGKLAEREKGDRRRSFVDAIVQKSGASNRTVLEALMPRLGLDDDAPETFTAGDVKKAVKAAQQLAPELFTKNNGNPKPPPGGGQRPPDNEAEGWKQKAAARSQQSGHAAYFDATKPRQ